MCMPGTPKNATAVQSTKRRIRRIDVSARIDGEVIRVPLQEIETLPLEDLEPIREFPFFQKQRRNPGWYWSSTTGDFTPYESRL